MDSEATVACGNCGEHLPESSSLQPGLRQPCPNCGSTQRAFAKQLSGTIEFKSKLGTKARRAALPIRAGPRSCSSVYRQVSSDTYGPFATVYDRLVEPLEGPNPVQRTADSQSLAVAAHRGVSPTLGKGDVSLLPERGQRKLDGREVGVDEGVIRTEGTDGAIGRSLPPIALNLTRSRVRDPVVGNP